MLFGLFVIDDLSSFYCVYVITTSKVTLIAYNRKTPTLLNIKEV